MARILIVAHAPLASALAGVARHVYPDCATVVESLDVASDEAVDGVEARAAEVLRRWADDEVLILSDVFGATPCNLALKLADGVRVRVVAGANVPMLWRTLCYSDEPLETLVTRAVAGATQGVMQVSVPRRQNQSAAAPSEHDQVQHSHQQ